MEGVNKGEKEGRKKSSDPQFSPQIDAQDVDLNVVHVGPTAKDVMFRVNESACNTYKVEYTPSVPGISSRPNVASYVVSRNVDSCLLLQLL